MMFPVEFEQEFAQLLGGLLSSVGSAAERIQMGEAVVKLRDKAQKERAVIMEQYFAETRPEHADRMLRAVLFLDGVMSTFQLFNTNIKEKGFGNGN